ncbi:hypothetical protein [Brevibacillus sp. NRS-1366]|uniref:hypothetical protein n=1 Tax=Brevibacillus sp. NRS-1366 TaxID=3233899 RepID=UPI003D19624D
MRGIHRHPRDTTRNIWTFAACAARHFDGTLKGRIVLIGGLGGMGGAQQLAAKLLGDVCIAAEIDPSRIQRRIEGSYCDIEVTDPAEAMRLALDAASRGEALGIAVLGNAAEVHEMLLEIGLQPDIVTDQTSAHDPLKRYVPAGYTYAEALELRESDPEKYRDAVGKTIIRHISAMISFQDQGAKVFEYGNFLRHQAEQYGFNGADRIRGFVVEYIRPHFCEGRGPFRWAYLN